MPFTKPKKAIGVDIGTHSVKAVQMSRARGRLHVDMVGYALVDRNKVNVDPVSAHADALLEAIQGMPVAGCLLVGALPGQTAVIRYPRVPDMPVSKIADWVKAEAGQNIPYDLSEVYLDSAPLETVTEGDEKMLRVLLVAAKQAAVESRMHVFDAAEVQFGVLTVDSLALADAAESCELLNAGESVALVNIGLTSVSIHFMRDGISNFIRDVNWGSRELVQAIARARHSEYEEAERLLADLGRADRKASPPVVEPPPSMDEFESAPAEPVSLGSPLDPLDEELMDSGAGAASVGREFGASETASDGDLQEVLRQPLERLVAEIRRSFDYYEHQLYERPVDRLIISGGVAHLPLVRENLSEELGVESVEVADPSNSGLILNHGQAVDLLRQRPAQFMVAVGLAARGMAEL